MIHNDNINLIELTNVIQDKVMSEINCHGVGRVLEFNKGAQTATIELMQVKQFNGENYPSTIIADVPLVIYGGGNANITFPDPVGTNVLLFFLDRNIDNFLATGESYIPGTTRMHDFTDCIAISSFKTLANPLENYDDLAVSILNEITIENILYKAHHKVYGDSIQQKVYTQDEEGNISGSSTSLTASTATMQVGGGSSIQLDSLVEIKNTAQSLASLMQALLTACEGITTVADESGGALTPSAKQAFTDLKAQFGGLLK